MYNLPGGSAANGGVGGIISLISGILGLATRPAAPAGMRPSSIDLALEPAEPAAGSTALLRIFVSGHHGSARYGISGVPVNVSLVDRPGVDARITDTALTTDGSGAAITVLSLSETRGRHLVRASAASLTTEVQVDTRPVVGQNAFPTVAGIDPAPLLIGAAVVLLIGLLAGMLPPSRLRPGLLTLQGQLEPPRGSTSRLRPRFSIAGDNLTSPGWQLAMAGGFALLAVFIGHLPVLVVAGAAAAIVVIGLTTWRPVVGCVILALAVPLTAGMGGNPVFPMVRPSEALSGLVAIGMLAHFVPKRRKLGFTTLDVAIAAFTIGGALVPWAVLYLSKQSVGIDTWRSVLAPLQYLLVYLLFSRLEVTADSLRLILQLEMLASVVIGVVGLAQLVDLPGVRDFIANAYPIAGQLNACQLGGCRPTSLLDHWSAFGAFAVLNYALALALVCTPAAKFPRRWLAVVMAVNVLAVLASQSPAAVIGLVVVTMIVLIHRDRVPRQLPVAGAGVAVAAGIFWTQIQVRAEPQPVAATAAVSSSADSLQKRDSSQSLLPLIQEHFWTGTGTVVPTQVPDRLSGYADNEYLRMGLRGGIFGEALLLLMLAAVAIVGWRSRGSPRPLIQALGAITLTSAVLIAVLGLGADYLSYAGVNQLFWMIVGLVGGSLLPVAAASWQGRQSQPLAPDWSS